MVKQSNDIKYDVYFNVFMGLYFVTLLGGEFDNCYGHGITEEGAVESLKLRINQLRRKVLA